MCYWIIKGIGRYMCSHCRLSQTELLPYCPFCGREASNYTALMIDRFKSKEDFKHEGTPLIREEPT